MVYFMCRSDNVLSERPSSRGDGRLPLVLPQPDDDSETSRNRRSPGSSPLPLPPGSCGVRGEARAAVVFRWVSEGEEQRIAIVSSEDGGLSKRRNILCYGSLTQRS